MEIRSVEAIFSNLLTPSPLPQIMRHSSFFGFFLALLAATAFAGVTRVKNDSERDRTTTPPAVQSPAPKQGLNFVVGAQGLDSLSFSGQSLLASRGSGELQPWKSGFGALL